MGRGSPVGLLVYSRAMSDPDANPDVYIDEIVERLEARFPQRDQNEIRTAVGLLA